MEDSHTPNGSNGYARIREVYQLFKEQDERFEKRLREMEDRIMESITAMRSEQTEHWRQHEIDSQSLRDKFRKSDEELALATAYRAGKAAPIGAVGRFTNWIESHWKVLSFGGFVFILIIERLLHISIIASILN